MSPNAERLVADAAALVAIPSVNPYGGAPGNGTGEAAVVAWLAERLAADGIETGRAEVLPGRANLWARVPGRGEGPALMLAGHTDTVGVEDYRGDPFAARVHDGRLHGRGAVDMKGALAAILEALRLARAEPLPGDLVAMFVVDEEDAMAGSRAAGLASPLADHVVVAEPTGLGIVTAHKGQRAVPIHVTGRSAHSSTPERGLNAVAALGPLLSAVAGWNAELRARPPHPLCGHASATPTLVAGGESHSAVPAGAVLTVDRRTLPGETAEALEAELLRMMASARLGRGFGICAGAPQPDVAALDTAPDGPLVRAAQAAARGLGLADTLGAFPGATDAPNFRIPAVVCGPGDLAQAHTNDEWIAVDQLPLAVTLWLDTARALAR